MRLTALADLPNGVRSGERFDVPDYQGSLLIRAKAAQLVDDTPGEDDDEPAATPTAPTRRAQTYRRRDMSAERTTATTSPERGAASAEPGAAPDRDDAESKL